LFTPLSAPIRTFHWTPSLKAVAQQAEAPSDSEERITEFQDLADKGLVNPNVIHAVTDRMNIKTMTEVQSMTINETLKGIDTYVIFISRSNERR
jgi:ATP-dependent RNA helicase MSS116